MHSSSQEKERKVVPRFRRRNENENLIDADDLEAQASIEKDLESDFKWTSDLTTEDLKYQFSNCQDNDQTNQHIQIFDQTNENFIYDIQINNQQLWNINIQDNDNRSIQWTYDQQQQNNSFSILNIEDQQEQKWSLNENNPELNQFHLIDQNCQLVKYDFDTINPNQQRNFIKGEQFRDEINFGIEYNDEELNLFPYDSEDIQSFEIDSTLPSIESILSLPQSPILLHWIEGISQYRLSLPVKQISQQFSPLNQREFQIDSQSLKCLKWSLELLKDNLIYSYLISLPNTDKEEYSFPEKYHLNFSTNEENNEEQLFSLNDQSFQRTISLESNDIPNQLLTLIDTIEIKQDFGNDDQSPLCQWSLEEVQTIVPNLSPKEYFSFLYSPLDVKSISLIQFLIESDDISARALRRYRCKHMSIKSDLQD